MSMLVKPFTWILSLVLIIIGVWGFFSDPVLVFDVSITHNLVHLLSGVLGVVAVSMGYRSARLFLIVFGLIYGLVTILGFLGVEQVVELLELNQEDNYLHLAITAGCLLIGFGSKKKL